MTAPFEPPPQDLGFGSVVGEARAKRLLNRDGSFNVQRRGRGGLASLNLYHTLLTVRWSTFLFLLVAAYLGLNALFAFGYYLCGPQAFTGTSDTLLGGRYWQAFFFSVDTFATIGYGNVAPIGVAANVIVTIESMVGLLGFALATGVLFARFARPVARIIFSSNAVIAPYRGGTGLMFRLVNGRSNQLIRLEMDVMFTRIETSRAGRTRKYTRLALERSSVMIFPLSWTVVHPIDENSPLFGLSYEQLVAMEAELLILLSAVDETFAQTVHARTSYKPEEIVFGARFGNIFNPTTADGVQSIDVGRIDEIVPAPLDGPMPMETGTWSHTGQFREFVPPPHQGRK